MIMVYITRVITTKIMFVSESVRNDLIRLWHFHNVCHIAVPAFEELFFGIFEEAGGGVGNVNNYEKSTNSNQNTIIN